MQKDQSNRLPLEAKKYRKHVSPSWMRNKWRGFVQRFGPDFLKRHQWDTEFSRGQWDYLEDSGDTQVCRQIERFACNGNVLDLGCGPGTTGLELNLESYSGYVGVDISEVAIAKARLRAEQSGRSTKNRYFQANILNFEPPGKYNVIFFGESIYYIRLAQIVPMLERYSRYLAPGGVLVVRVFDGRRELNVRILRDISETFDIVAKDVLGPDFATLLVFRRRGNAG